MKRLVLFLSIASLSSPFISVAQNQDKVTGAMVVHTTETIVKQPVVTPKEEPVKERKKLKAVEIKRGYQQEVSFAYSLMFDTGSMINLNYVGGYRFNHHFYVGLGTGLDFSTNNSNDFFIGYGEYTPYSYGSIRYSHIPQYEIDNLSSSELKIGKRYFDYAENNYWDFPMQTVAVPLYVHLRTYFMKTKWTPFLAFSAGVRLSSSKKMDVYNVQRTEGYYSWDVNYYVGDFSHTYTYGAVTGMFELMPGVSYQHKSGKAFNFQFGFATRSGDYCIVEYENSNEGIAHYWAVGFTMRLGVVF